MRCLVIGEQDAHLDRFSRFFKERGWQVVHFPSVASVQKNAGAADLVIIASQTDDEMLKSDIALARRACGDSIIVVAGAFSVPARLRALEMGANEFVPSAISLQLLHARITALLRLRRPQFSHVHNVDGLTVDVVHRRVLEGEQEIHLSHKEFQLLMALVERYGETLSRSEIIETLWGDAGRVEDNTLENLVARLRRKIQQAGRTRRIVTVRGIGYRLETVG